MPSPFALIAPQFSPGLDIPGTCWSHWHIGDVWSHLLLTAQVFTKACVSCAPSAVSLKVRTTGRPGFDVDWLVKLRKNVSLNISCFSASVTESAMDKVCCGVWGFWYRTWRPATPGKLATKLAKIILSAFSWWMRCATGWLSLQISFYTSALHRSANFWCPFFLACFQPNKILLIGVHASKAFPKHFFKSFLVVSSAWSSKHVLWNDLAGLQVLVP